MNHNIERLHIEQLILSSYLNQLRTNELDQMEFRDTKIPFELFKANNTNSLTAKAIYNMQSNNEPIDDLTVLCYIEKHMPINEMEWLELVSNLWCTFDTMISYLKRLKKIDENENKARLLKAMR